MTAYAPGERIGAAQNGSARPWGVRTRQVGRGARGKIGISKQFHPLQSYSVPKGAPGIKNQGFIRAESELCEGSAESTEWGKGLICLVKARKGDKSLHYLYPPRLVC